MYKGLIIPMGCFALVALLLAGPGLEAQVPVPPATPAPATPAPATPAPVAPAPVAPQPAATMPVSAPAQATPIGDTTSVVVRKDPRIDLLIRKQAEINETTTRDSRRNIPGFRIQVVNSPDRNKVFAMKTRIYQEFPDLKPYLLYQAPNYKLKVGNFRTQEEAEEFQKQLSRLFPSGLYVIRDVIEVNPGP